MHPSPGFDILPAVITFIGVWLVGVVAFALVKSRASKYDPLPPEMPEHHDDHGHDDHGGDHGGHDAHGHADPHGHH